MRRHRSMQLVGDTWQMAYLNVYLSRDADEDEALVHIHSEETEKELRLTLDEARTRLADPQHHERPPQSWCGGRSLARVSASPDPPGTARHLPPDRFGAAPAVGLDYVRPAPRSTVSARTCEAGNVSMWLAQLCRSAVLHLTQPLAGRILPLTASSSCSRRRSPRDHQHTQPRPLWVTETCPRKGDAHVAGRVATARAERVRPVRGVSDAADLPAQTSSGRRQSQSR